MDADGSTRKKRKNTDGNTKVKRKKNITLLTHQPPTQESQIKKKTKKRRHRKKRPIDVEPQPSTSHSHTGSPISVFSKHQKTTSEIHHKKKRKHDDTPHHEGQNKKKKRKKRAKPLHNNGVVAAAATAVAAPTNHNEDDMQPPVVTADDTPDPHLLQQELPRRRKKRRRVNRKHEMTEESRSLLRALGRNARKVKYRIRTRQMPNEDARPYHIKLVKSLQFGKDVGLAKDNEYEVKFDNNLNGQTIEKLMYALESLFDDIIADTRQAVQSGDLARIVIMHDSIDNPIVIPLRPIEMLTGAVVLNKVENTLNSVKTLKMDESFRVNIGVIQLPQFGGDGKNVAEEQKVIKTTPKEGKSSSVKRVKHKDTLNQQDKQPTKAATGGGDTPARQTGKAPRKPTHMYLHTHNEIRKKRSVISVTHDGVLCMSRAIAICWVKHCNVSNKQFKGLSQPEIDFAKSHQLPRPNNIYFFLKYRVATTTFYNSVKKQVYYTRGKIAKPSPLQKKLAVKLCELAGVDPNKKASLADIEKFEKATGMDICIVSRQAGGKFITPPSRGKNKLFLYKDGNHFDAITNITGFFPKSRFCYNCLQPYESASSHICDICCDMCARQGCIKTNPVTCLKCNRVCRNEECLQIHKDKDVCERKWKCRMCNATFNLQKRKRQPSDHKCGEYLCASCNRYVVKPHLCYNRAAPPVTTPLKVIHFDFECAQDTLKTCENGYKATNSNRCDTCAPKISMCGACFRCVNCNNEACGRPIHTPNLVIAHSSCDMCEILDVNDEACCLTCGSRCDLCNTIVKQKTADGLTYEYATLPCDGCGKRKISFAGNNTLNNFGAWLFNTAHTDFTVIAHNMKGYDGVFLMNYLNNNGLTPKVTYSGTKIMNIHIEKGLNIRVIDSINFLQAPLSTFPKTFDLINMKKGEFPHLFNTEANQNYVGKYPPPKYYNVDNMTKVRRKEFLKWYKAIPKDSVFDFRKEIASYCDDDVSILRQATLKFRRILIGLTGKTRTIEKDGLFEEEKYDYVDLFQHTTIAGVAMKVYRTLFLEEKVKVSYTKADGWNVPNQCVTKKHNNYYDTSGKELEYNEIKGESFISSPIAFIPPDLYNCSDNYSKVALQWINWVSYKRGINIQHALNGGEKTVRLFDSCFKLDGFYSNEDAGIYTAYEMNGCQWHGCLECYPVNRDAAVCGSDDDTLNIRYARTLRKKKMLENAGYEVVSIWQCEFNQLVKTDTQLQDFIKELEETSDYLVGRLDPRESFFGGRTNATKMYRRAKPGEKILYYDVTSMYPDRMKYARFGVGHPEIITTDFGDLSEYFGLVKLKILAPDNLYLPVLPFRSGGKLKFALCRTCATNENKAPCTCSPEQRAFLGTWGTDEVNLALEMGYKVVKVYEVYHWNETAIYDEKTQKGGLFSEYINTWVKIKQEASGWPASVDQNDPISKKKFVKIFFSKEGILLEESNIKINQGLRAVSKLLLNSLWGKYGQRTHYNNTVFFDESQCESFFALFLDKTKKVQNFTIVSDSTLMVEYETAQGFTKANKQSNIFIAAFTTMHARIKLYKILRQLKERVLYMDTDSVIFVSEPGNDPLLGDYLGDLTSEISLADGEYIIEFASCGPKNYAYRTASGKRVCKIRGFSLNYKNNKILNMKALREMVTHNCLGVHVLYNESKICRSKTNSTIYNRPEERVYRMVYTKRVIVDNYDTKPYGYKE